MRKLTPIDMAFLLAERRHQPLHVGALSLFQPPPGAPPDLAGQIAKRLRKSRHAAAPFNRRLAHRLGLAAWVEAQDFDIDQHFVHLSLPRPGRIRELLAMISRIHSAHLDRAYPLWRSYLIEGLEDGRIALYSKMHHSVVDGVAGIRLMLKSMSADPHESLSLPPPWDMPACSQKLARVPSLPTGSIGVREWLLDSARATPKLIAQIRQELGAIRAGHVDAVSSNQAPRCLLNQPITGSRRFAAQSYSTARIKAVARALDATANDIILTLCGGALRQYLSEQDALPAEPLIACVPVSIRRDDSTEGNQVTLALANLATHLADPLDRARLVKASMDHNKAVFRSLSPSQLLAYSLAMLAPGALTLLPGLGRRHTVANVVISHVPGPREDLYWQGCKLDGIYPASLVLDNFALNITLISRHDAIDFGILACRRTLPKIQRLLDHIETELGALELALGLDQGPLTPAAPEARHARVATNGLGAVA